MAKTPRPPEHPATSAVAITPHATDPVHATKGPTRSLYVGGSGDITCRLDEDAVDVVFVNVPVGVLPVSVEYVRAIGTSATSIVGLW